MATWVESGAEKTAPEVDADKFGKHDYGDHFGTSDCLHGCECWMGGWGSGGPIDPFGRCPNNPISPEQRIEELKDQIHDLKQEIENLKEEIANFEFPA